MAKLTLNVPVILIREEEFWLEITNSLGQTALIQIAQVDQLSIIDTWAKEQVTKAMNGRRNTGVLDMAGDIVREGDILMKQPGDDFVVGVVRFDVSRAAFVLTGKNEDGTHWTSENLLNSRQWSIIGNIFQHPEKLK